jgi:hypothetical protein
MALPLSSGISQNHCSWIVSGLKYMINFRKMIYTNLSLCLDTI